MNQFGRAKEYDNKVLEVEPDDPETYFNRQAYNSDIKTADDWVDLTIATKKTNAAVSAAR